MLVVVSVHYLLMLSMLVVQTLLQLLETLELCWTFKSLLGILETYWKSGSWLEKFADGPIYFIIANVAAVADE